ncbi:MAG: preprotein translocase subunit SecF [Parcubacteria group bacterium Athens0416_74]|nr:MAG: preprotein translocase subunit SecF [Parcubacteria group bacterium Athens0416_74]
MIIIRNRIIFFAISALLALGSLGALFTYGLEAGTDFTGGSLAEVRYEGARPETSMLTKQLESAGFHGFSLRESGDNGYTLRAATLTNEQRGNLASILSSETSAANISQLSEVGPTIGVELRNKAYVAVGLVLLCILLFIAFAFRKVSKPISSWVYGLIALVTLGFDVLIPLGFFAVLGHYVGVQVDTLFVTAILTILGFSIHDTIVVFDRTRENLRINEEKGRREDFAETTGRSINQTFVRSINTSLTVFLTLVALYMLGPVSTEYFALTLLVGIIAGTYSSIFLATPLLVVVERWRAKK